MATTPWELFTGDGTAGPWQFTFELVGNFSAILVKVRDTDEDSFVTQTVDVQYSLVRSTKTVTHLAGFFPPTGAVIRIERFTTRDRQIDYVSGSTLSERNLDNDANRLTMVDQEIEAGLLDALRRNDARDAWNGENIPSEDCADAIAADGWVTLRQMQAAIDGGEPVDISGATVYTLGPGDGTTSQYELTGSSGLTTSQVDAYLASVYQSSSGSDFVIIGADESTYPSWGLGDDVIDFTDPPTLNATIECKIITGSVTAVIANDSVDTAQIKDDAVTLAKINVGAGDVTRFIVADAAGDVTARQIEALDLLGTEDGDLSAGVLRSAILNDITIDQFSGAAGGTIDMGGNRILAVADPTGGTDAANRQWVLSEIGTVTPDTSRRATGLIPTSGLPTFIDAAEGLNFEPDIVWFYLQQGWTHVGGDVHQWQRQVLCYMKNGAPSGGLAGFDHSQFLSVLSQVGALTNFLNIAQVWTNNGTTGFRFGWTNGAQGAMSWFAIKV